MFTAERSASMKSFFALSTAALLIGLSQTALAEGRSNDREKRSVCSRGESCGTLSQADRENLSRAMSRNVLQSIDDRLRRQRSN
jgi:hypothetical protein